MDPKGRLLMKKLLLFCVLLPFLATCASGPAIAPEPSDPALKSTKTVFERKCSLCHGISRALRKNKTATEWSQTIVRMQKKIPDQISDADVKAIVAYLNAVRGPKE